MEKSSGKLLPWVDETGLCRSSSFHLASRTNPCVPHIASHHPIGRTNPASAYNTELGYDWRIISDQYGLRKMRPTLPLHEPGTGAQQAAGHFGTGWHNLVVPYGRVFSYAVNIMKRKVKCLDMRLDLHH